MGITINDFFENIYSAIFSPKDFFENNRQISIRVAIGTIALSYSVYKISEYIAGDKIIDYSFVFPFVFGFIKVVIFWFLTSLFFEYCAKIFSNENKLQLILFNTAYAQLPYIFFAPLNIVKQIGDLGYIFASITEFFLYLWVIILYAYSVSSAYKISFARSFMLILMPFIASFFAIYWTVCFFMKIGYIFSI